LTPAIREYQRGDLDRCRELWRSLTQRHRDIYGDPTLGGSDPGLEFDSYLVEALPHRVWVAELDGRVLGLCGLLVRGEESELEPIVVDPSQRSRGIGALLAQEAVAESRRLGVKYVNVRPTARNLEAIRFFHREGFRLLGRFELSIALDAATPFGSARTTEVHDLTFDY
jgi:N-acetylglutamate synthase-like GNAT family acetyltransferase